MVYTAVHTTYRTLITLGTSETYNQTHVNTAAVSSSDAACDTVSESLFRSSPRITENMHTLYGKQTVYDIKQLGA